jgi:hypothetical protein
MNNFWLSILFSIVVAIPIVVILRLGWTAPEKHAPDHLWRYLKDLAVPLVIPTLAVIITVWFTKQSERRQRAEAESDKQTAIMREVMVSKDRNFISYIIAVDSQLIGHLLRSTNSQPDSFDAEAAFFFFGLHRAALINLEASKGNLVFPRVWIEEAFHEMAKNVVTNILGADENSPQVSAIGEAVMYKYFGSANNDDSGSSGKDEHSRSGPLLIDFHRLLAETNPIRSSPKDAEDLKVLSEELGKFRERLKNKKMVNELIEDLLIMDALVYYSYNSVFGNWYNLPKHLREEMPSVPLQTNSPPRLFVDALAAINRPTYTTNAWVRVCKLVNH